MELTNYLITVAGTDIRFYCKENEFILEAMKRSGSGPICYGCHGGGCGVCKMKLLSGKFKVAKPMSRAHISIAELAAGIVLICCVKPLSGITLASMK